MKTATLTQLDPRARLADMANEGLTKALYIRVALSDIEKLDALVPKMKGIAKNAIARAAMRIGMEILASEPAKFFDTPVAKRGGARTRRKP